MPDDFKNKNAMYINGQMPPEMRQVAPDFSKWRALFLRMNFSVAVATLIFEVIGSLLLYIFGYVEELSVNHWLKYAVIPSALNFAAVGTEAFILKKMPEKDRLQDFTVITVVSVMCTIIACAHCRLENTLAVFIMPVFITIVFYNKLLTVYAGVIGFIGLIFAAVFRYFEMGADNLFPEVITSAALIFLSVALAQLMNSLVDGQKSKLISAVAEAKKAQHEAFAANNAKSDFLANMSHEIRTPINAVLGMNEMILREERDKTIREYAENIRTSGTLLLSIINDVLDISKIESGKIEITPVAYDVSSLINDCYNMTAARAHEKGLELHVECDEELPRMLRGDEARIRQITVNLLINAVKYSERGTVTFRINGSFSGEKFILSISVKDMGIGISEENIGKLFNQFCRLDLERNRNIEGTGLGLTIVKHLVDLMGGEIKVSSKINEGSEFSVTVPQETVDRTPVGSIQLNYTHDGEYEYVQSFEAPDARILAVDDVPVNLKVITNMLKETLVRIDTASCGKEALELTEQNHYDLILMDHMMPEMDGVETFAKLRADKNSKCASTPVIMLTANALSGVREKYMHEGFADYISKPVRGKKLEDTVRKYLPADLIRPVSEGTDNTHENTSADESPESRLEKELAEKLPELNLRTALPYCCDSMELFMSILKDYAEGNRYDEIKSAYEEERFDDYRRSVHTLKSTSLTVGLEGLSERARSSEFALKCDCVDYVKMNHTDLMEMYGSILDRIKDFLKDKEI